MPTERISGAPEEKERQREERGKKEEEKKEKIEIMIRFMGAFSTEPSSFIIGAAT